MPDITREQLAAYLEDSLSTHDTAVVEQALRDSDDLREHLRAIMQEMDRGEHSIGAIWRRERLTCPSREQLGSYLLSALDPDVQDYFDFHLNIIGCPYCQANLTDLQSLHQTSDATTQERRQRIFQSGAGMVKAVKDNK